MKKIITGIVLAGLVLLIVSCADKNPGTPAVVATATLTPSATLTATLTSTSTPVCTPTVTATYTDNPMLTVFSPAGGTYNTGSVVSTTVSINQPAPIAGTLISLYTTGGIGSVPAQVLVPGGMSSATFDLEISAFSSAGTLNAQIGLQVISADILVVEP